MKTTRRGFLGALLALPVALGMKLPEAEPEVPEEGLPLGGLIEQIYGDRERIWVKTGNHPGYFYASAETLDDVCEELLIARHYFELRTYQHPNEIRVMAMTWIQDEDLPRGEYFLKVGPPALKRIMGTIGLSPEALKMMGMGG